MSRIPTRPRAFAIITLIAALLLTAHPADTVVAAPPSASTSQPSPTDVVAPTPEPNMGASATLAAELAEATPAATTLGAPATGVMGSHADRAQGGSGAALQASAQAAPASVSAASIVVAFARSHLRARYQSSGTGPTGFDCSGLTWRVFREAGLAAKITSQSARSIYQSYRSRGLASRRNPKIGDLVVWGNGSHIGIYVGGGNAISALVRGVRVHRVRAMLTPFTAYLHTHLASVARPAWELQVATHMRTLRHTTRTVVLRAEPSSASLRVASLRSGTKFVVLARRKDGAGRLWLRAMTLGGRVGWIPALASAR